MSRLHSFVTMLAFWCLSIASTTLSAQEEGCSYTFKSSDRKEFDKGVQAYNSGHYRQCMNLMRKVSMKNRLAAEPYYYMGVSALKCGERPAAIRDHFVKLFKICPNYPSPLAHYYMGIVQYSSKNYAEAVEELNRYFEMAKGNPSRETDAVYEEASVYLYWSEFLAQSSDNRVPFYPVAVCGASSNQDEYMPYLSIDGTEFYYLRRITDPAQRTFYDREPDKKVLRLFCSKIKSETNKGQQSEFSSGTLLPYPFERISDPLGMTATADGNTMYIAATRNDGKCRILVIERKNGVWQEPHDAGPNINCGNCQTFPSVTPDGETLYFSSDKKGGMGGNDIWVCRKNSNREWGEAENLGSSVNTTGDERCPYIAADKHTLYFASNGWQGFGGQDIFLVDLEAGQTNIPTNIGLPVNSEDDDLFIGITTDGRKGYFAGRPKPDEEGNLPEWLSECPSNPTGGNDIYFFELYPAAQPEEMTVVKGQLLPHNASKVFIDVFRNQVASQQEAKAFGHYTVNNDFSIVIPAKGTCTIEIRAEGYDTQTISGTAGQLRQRLATGIQLKEK